MSSKKAKRKKEYLERVKKRDQEKLEMTKFQRAMEADNIEEMAAIFGVKLK